ncbi:hypothetical protein DENSPDRAFT_838277 [Dentipellis sp. KUC8613]|nr:hypothetical protein DENSPDRAFT_838277 [Dentipellis sp. KUC8613]
MNRLASYAASSSRHARRIAAPRACAARLYSSDAPTPPPPSHTPASSRDGAKKPEAAPSKFDLGLPFPDLMETDALFDMKEVRKVPPSRHSRYPARITIRNDPSMFLSERALHPELEAEAEQERKSNAEEEEEEKEEGEGGISYKHMPYSSPEERASLRVITLIRRRVTQQTGKGKIHRQHVLAVVGNGDGLVGYGEGKDAEYAPAYRKAYAEAMRSMDFVERFEQRTIWTEMESKMGGTQIILRPRPVGFGLHCNPNIHEILKAAGIKDISAKVWGSRNPLNVIKLLFRMLHAGNAPLAMGDGIGGKGRKLEKGSGVRGKQEIERERGRKVLNLNTW